MGSVAVLGVCGIPFHLAGQTGRTAIVRGIVVDEAGMPVGNSRVAVHPLFGKKIEAAAASGEFAIEVPAISNEMMLAARNETGELQGMGFVRARENEPIRVTLRKGRELVVTVTDAAKMPIGGARVGVEAGNSFLRQGMIAEAMTDDDGRAVLRFPAEASLQSVFAVKRDVGVNLKMLSVGPVEAQTLVLGDNATIPMRVIDDEDKPLAGVSIRPVSLGRGIFAWREFEELRTTTDAMGRATLSMIPAELITRVTFDIELEDYAVIQRMVYDARTSPAAITARLAPLVTLRGKVVGADGKPPSGPTEIHAAGAGYHPQETSGTFGPRWRAGDRGVGFKASCDESGAFELRVARNQYYALMAWGIPHLARKDSIVSPIQMRVVGGESPAEEISFKLGPGTRISGVTTPARSGSQMMELVWRDRESYAKLPTEQRLPNRDGKTVEIAPELVQNVSPGPDGRFEFIVPSGRYTLSAKSSGGEPKTIEVTDQAEIKADFEASGVNPAVARAAPNPQAQGPMKVIDLAGRVVLEADKEHGIAGVSVRRIDLGGRIGAVPRGASSPFGISGGDGTFKMARPEGESLLVCSTADGLLSSLVKIPATATEVVVPLAPTATVRGRLIDSQTKKPLVGQQIETMIRTDQFMSTTLGPRALTDARGEFTLTGLTPGWPIAVQLTTMGTSPDGRANLASRRSQNLKMVTAAKAEVQNIGDVPARPFQMPSLEQVVGNATGNGFVRNEQPQAELGLAELLGQRVIVFAANSESEVCREFMRLWYGVDEQAVEEARNRGLSEMAGQFVLLAVDTTRTRPRPVIIRTILERSKLKEPPADDAGLAILRSDGEVLATITGGELSNDGKLDAAKLAAFLRKHVAALPEAEKLLADAVGEAKRLSKRVLVFQSVPLSAPSALISLWLESQQELLAKDYVCVTLAERYVGGAVAVRRAGGEVSREPWVAILDDSGKQVATGAVGAAELERMLKGTGRKLSEEEIRAVVRAVWVP